MSTRRIAFYLSLAFLLLVLVGIPIRSQYVEATAGGTQSIIAGRNVNVASGTKLPFGDPWLQRQNEPSIAASTRNSMHLFAGANDYRTIDVPDQFELPGIQGAANAHDAWLGVYESFDGGQSWITTLLPGFPQDSSAEGQLSPIKGYQTACDPIIRAGANGLFYYCGIAFDRNKNRSAVFVARYQDNNNLEKVEVKIEGGERKYFGPIRYIDTKLVATGSTSSSFIDMPNMAVDIPRKGALYGNIYVAYTVFTDTSQNNTQDRIMFQRSTDGGVTWSAPPVQLSTTGELVQRPVIAVDPIDLTGKTIYVAFRRFAGGSVPDGIVVVRSTDGGKTFSKLPDVASSFYPFDQGTSPTSFRTNSYPTMAVGDLGTVYVAWSERQGGPSGQARIMISAFRKGWLAWTTPQIVDQNYAGIGHQFMPSLTFVAWKLMLAWYDQRGDEALDSLQFIEDSPGVRRHTIDVRAAEGRPGVPPSFSPSIQVSRYLHVLDLDANGNPKTDENGYQKVIQAEASYINYPLFQLGTVPFHGDYLEITASSRILPPAVAFGRWIYNINPLEPTNFHAAWADNRDVRPPGGDTWGNWTNYSAPNSVQDSGWEGPLCSNGSNTGMRNQNIYTANINNGVIMGSPGNTKQLDLPLSGEGGRSFVVFVRNTTASEKTLRLVILQIGLVNASFDQFENDDSMQVKVQPYSSVSCTVYVDRSTRTLAPVTVNAFEGLKLVGYVILNPDPTNLPLSDPDTPFQNLGNETHDPDVSAPLVWNYDLGDESDPNASAILAPRVHNSQVQNYSVVNPRIQQEGVLNPRVHNESIVNNEVSNPRVHNAVVPNGALTDVTWTVTNEGNTTSAFTINIQSPSPDYFNGDDPPLIAQVLVYRINKVPVDKDCQLNETHQDELMDNVSSPRVHNPRVHNIAPTSTALGIQDFPMSTQAADLTAEDITFYLAPGEQADVIFRVWDEDTTDGRPTFDPNMVIAEAVAEAVNTEDVEGGSTTPPYDDPPNPEPWTTPSPEIGLSPSSLSFEAWSGTNPADQIITVWNSGSGTVNYTISDDAGWLSVAPSSGTSLSLYNVQEHTVSVNTFGLTPGSYSAMITITDPYAANNPTKVPVALVLYAGPPPLFITTVSVPDGVRDTPYSTYLYCSGGVGDATWSVSAGALPPGLSLETTDGGTGWITGTPTAAGYFEFTVQARDEYPQTVTKAFSMTVADWVARYNGPINSYDTASAIAFDSSGNSYVTGLSRGSGANYDATTIKYNSSGSEQWVAQYNGPSNAGDGGRAIAVDALGYVYVTGTSYGSGTENDVITIKYNNSGVEQWARRYDGPGHFQEAGEAIAVDASGNVYVTGYSQGVGGNSDIVTIKYDGSGTEQWVARFDGPANYGDAARAIAVDSSGNVYVTGDSVGYEIGGLDCVTIKYNSAGVEQWVARYNSPILELDFGEAITLDASGNVYVAGWSGQTGPWHDYITIKYDNLGNEQWVATYNGTGNRDDEAHAIAVDAFGNVYVTGDSAGSGTELDYATIKYSSSGVEEWVARYNGAVDGEDSARSIAVNPLGDVYVTGYSYGSPTSSDYATVKYNSVGVLQWAARYNGPGNDMDRGNATAIDPLGNIEVTGWSVGSGTLNDYATIRYIQSFPTTLIITTEALDIGYVGTPYAATVWAFGGSGSRTWSIISGALPSGMDLSSVTGRIAGTPNTPGTYNFTVKVVDGGLTATKPLSITITTASVGPPHQLAFSQQPTDTALGATITPAVTVEIRDSAGNLVTTATNTVTLSLSVNPSGATLNGDVSKAAVGGIATFDDLSIDKLGTGYALKAESGSLTEVDSSAFNITGGSLSRIQVETAPDGSGTIVPAQNVPAGSMISVYAISRDAGGNFIANVAADSWSLVNETGGVVDGDLAPWEGFTGAFFVGNLPGTAQIHVAKTGLTSVDSGVLTIIPASLSLTVAVGSDNSFDVIVDGFVIDTIPKDTTRTYSLSQLVGSHSVILRAKTDKDTIASAGMMQNSADYLFSTASTSSGIWDNFNFTEAAINGLFHYGYLPPHVGDFSFTYTITYRTKETYKENYELVTKWGSNGTGDGQFDHPDGVAVDSSGYVYVVDTMNERIQKFTSTGEFVTKWGSLGTGDGRFNYPYGVAVDSSGYVYVADEGNDRIQKFTSTGEFVTKWGSTGTGDGQFNQPYGIAVDSTGNVYVADAANDRIQKFTSTGEFVTKWGSLGTGDGRFNYPSGVAADIWEGIYVSDFYNYRIQKFTSTGEFVTKWGSEGTGDGQFSYTVAVAVDVFSDVYVADTYNHRIQKFTSTGEFVTKWGSLGTGDGQFDHPQGVVADGTGNVYIVDSRNHRIQKFRKKYE